MSGPHRGLTRRLGERLWWWVIELVPSQARNRSLPSRAVLVSVGLFVFAYGLVMTLQSGIGLGPWTVLAQGLTRVVPISFGTATNVLGVLVVLGALALGIRPALATLMNIALVGVYSDLILAYDLIPNYREAGWTPTDLVARGLLAAGGTVVVGLATAIYIKGGLGAGPRDSLMLGLVQRFRSSIVRVRTAIEVIVLIVGVLLGGTAGIGTVIWAFGIGPSVQAGFRLFRVQISPSRVVSSSGAEELRPPGGPSPGRVQ